MENKNLLDHKKFGLQSRETGRHEYGENTEKKSKVSIDKDLFQLQSDKNFQRDENTLNQTKIQLGILCLKNMYRNLVLLHFNVNTFWGCFH